MTSNIDILYIIGNDFLSRFKNLRSLPENETSFGLAPLSKFWQFVSKSMFDNLVTFTANGGHHYNRGDERNLLEPWATINCGQRRWIKAIFPQLFSLATKLPSPPIDVFRSSSGRACRGWMIRQQRSALGHGSRWEREKQEIEREN